MAAYETALLRTSARLGRPALRQSSGLDTTLPISTTTTTTASHRAFTTTPNNALPQGFNPMSFSSPSQSSSNIPSSYFQRPSLPANTIVRFVPQQTAWVVERMGKFHRILPPGVAVMLPFLDRIAYVKSLKEVALEIPSQSAITADNVTLDLDGVLYTRVFDAYKARYVYCRELYIVFSCLLRHFTKGENKHLRHSQESRLT